MCSRPAPAHPISTAAGAGRPAAGACRMPGAVALRDVPPPTQTAGVLSRSGRSVGRGAGAQGDGQGRRRGPPNTLPRACRLQGSGGRRTQATGAVFARMRRRRCAVPDSRRRGRRLPPRPRLPRQLPRARAAGRAGIAVLWGGPRGRSPPMRPRCPPRGQALSCQGMRRRTTSRTPVRARQCPAAASARTARLTGRARRPAAQSCAARLPCPVSPRRPIRGSSTSFDKQVKIFAPRPAQIAPQGAACGRAAAPAPTVRGMPRPGRGAAGSRAARPAFCPRQAAPS